MISLFHLGKYKHRLQISYRFSIAEIDALGSILFFAGNEGVKEMHATFRANITTFFSRFLSAVRCEQASLRLHQQSKGNTTFREENTRQFSHPPLFSIPNRSPLDR